MTPKKHMTERYAQGNVPWDHDDPPPEVLDFVPTLSPGRALDMGCGYGRASIYLAQMGWQVDGVDFVEQALVEARRRAAQAGVAPQFYQGNVTDLHFLSGPYDFVLDVGCAHNLDAAELHAYGNEVRRLLAPGGYYMLSARLGQKESPAEHGPRGLEEATVRTLFSEGFELLKMTRGTTRVVNSSTWSSGWFWYRRVENA